MKPFSVLPCGELYFIRCPFGIKILYCSFKLVNKHFYQVHPEACYMAVHKRDRYPDPVIMKNELEIIRRDLF